MTTVWWLLPIVTPLVAAVAALLPTSVLPSSLRAWLLAVAPIPAVALGLLGAPLGDARLDWLLLDLTLFLDVPGRSLLVMSGVVWALAGASARRLATEAPGFAALFLLTMAGNVGVVLAGDVVGLYVMFAVMTFAAYGLVVHERTPFALRAGRVYVVLSVLGEVALLSAIVFAVGAAESTSFIDVQEAIVSARGWERNLIVGLFIGGFGVKAGVVPLHVWLPLAHPAAPVPASAVLSGAMIKAGLLGWIRVLPLGAVALEAWAVALVVVGLVSAFYGVAVGLLQREVKVVLAYSSISQMGLMATVVGAGLWLPDAGALAAVAVATYAFHHGVTKAALFLGVGIWKGGISPERHRWLLGGMALAALSLAGAPLTSGWVAKQVVKDVIETLPAGVASWLTLLLSLAAAGTTLLMARSLWLIRQPQADVRTDMSLVAPWVVLLGLMVVASWWLPPDWSGQSEVPQRGLSYLWDGAWPVLLGGVMIGVWAASERRWAIASRVPKVPAGDAVVLIEAAGPPVGAVTERIAEHVRAIGEWRRTLQASGALLARPGQGVRRLEEWLTRWRVAGAMFGLVTAALLIALAVGRV